MKPVFVFLLFLLLSFSLGACTPLKALPPDHLSASQHEDRAEQMIQNQDYRGAATQMALAIAKAPEDAHLYLLRGSLLEALGRNRQAEEAYRTGLKLTAAGSSLAADFSYRLALFYLLKERSPAQARPLIPAVPADSIPGLDLQAVLQLQQDKPRAALQTINQALSEQPDENETARLLYHGALAYQRLKDRADLNLAIFRAVGRAEDPDLVEDIQRFWTGIKSSNK